VGSVKDIPELQVCTCIYLQYEGWCGVISDVVGQLVTNISLSWLSIIECMTIEHMVVAIDHVKLVIMSKVLLILASYMHSVPYFPLGCMTFIPWGADVYRYFSGVSVIDSCECHLQLVTCQARSTGLADSKIASHSCA
jgi:hypothetical protein